MAKNDVSTAVGMGFYIPVTATALCLQTFRLILFYDVFGVVSIFLIFRNDENPSVEFSQILFGFLTIMLANHILLAARKNLENSLKSEVNNFHQLFNSTFEGIAIVKDEIITQTNLPLENIFGYQLVGRPIGQLLDLRDGDNFETTGYKGKQRKHILLNVKRKKLPRRHGQTALFSITDVTIERERDAKLANTNKLAALGEVSGGIAHKINNPLALIHCSAAVLSEFIEEDQFDRTIIKKHINLIQNTVDRISKIIIALRQFLKDGSKDNFSLVPAKKNYLMMFYRFVMLR